MRQKIIRITFGHPWVKWCLSNIYKVCRKAYYEQTYAKFREKYDIHKSFKFNGVDIEFYGDGSIIVGQDSYVGNRTVLAASKGQKIQIGNNCAISHNVRIYTSNRNANDIIKENEHISQRKGDVVIGNDVWISANVFITEGVNIGNNCVIGANSVVTKNIPSNCVAAGTPAIVIKTAS